MKSQLVTPLIDASPHRESLTKAEDSPPNVLEAAEGDSIRLEWIDALKIAFSGGSVMGFCVVGLGVLGLSVLFLVYSKIFGRGTNDMETRSSFLNRMSRRVQEV